MKIHMNRSIPGSNDGIHTQLFEAGKQYIVGTDITQSLADVFLGMPNVATIIEDGVEPPIKQAFSMPPETKEDSEYQEQKEADIIRGMDKDELELLIQEKKLKVKYNKKTEKKELAEKVIKALELE